MSNALSEKYNHLWGFAFIFIIIAIALQPTKLALTIGSHVFSPSLISMAAFFVFTTVLFFKDQDKSSAIFTGLLSIVILILPRI